ncbi:MAG TPA: (2Fe-2S)-binding protein [Dongiaceae bacterium]|nr:(2Fe-2S)-binding protein [Dongiaceae bacterium]
MAGQFQRLHDQQRAEVEIIVDGDRLRILEGDTLLTAILLHRRHLRLDEIGNEQRGGFCLMGACQDCWVSDGWGRPLRACTTYVSPHLVIDTGRSHLTGGSPAAALSALSAPAAQKMTTIDIDGADDAGSDDADSDEAAPVVQPPADETQP